MLWGGNVYVGIDHWIATETSWDKISGALTPNRVFTLRYEELVARPIETLGKVCRFAGKEFSPLMLSYDATSTYSKPNSSLIEQWRRKQTARDIGLVEAKVGDLLESRRYKPSGYAPVVPGCFCRALLQMQSKTFVTWRSIRRYGFRDISMLLIGRWLGLSALRNLAQSSVDRKSTAYLK